MDSTKKILRMLSKGILVLTGLFLLGFLGYTAYRGIKFRPYKVRVTNVTDSAFTVSWVTDSPMPGIVYYGEKNTFLPGPLAWLGKKKAVDDRDFSNTQGECISKFNEEASKNKDENFTIDADGFDCSDVKVWKYGKYFTHHVTVQNLDAEKEYFFKVGDGVLSYSKGKIDGVVYVEREIPEIDSFKQKTLPMITKVEAPNTAYGTSYNIYYREDGTMGEKKNFDSLIFLKTFKGEEDLPYLSSVTNSSGGWTIDLANVRTADGTVVSMDGALLEFMPQVENLKPGASGGSYYEDTKFPLNLLGNSEDDWGEKKEVLSSSIKDLLVRRSIAVETDRVTCYKCIGTTVTSKVFQEECGAGYTLSKPNCQTTTKTVACYQCNGTEVTLKYFENECGAGYTSSKPNCQPAIERVTCYKCSGTTVTSQTFNDECGSGYTLSKPNCQSVTKKVVCYKCNFESVISQTFDNECGAGFKLEKPDCKTVPKSEEDTCSDNMVKGETLKASCENGKAVCYVRYYDKIGGNKKLCKLEKVTGDLCGDSKLCEWSEKVLCYKVGYCDSPKLVNENECLAEYTDRDTCISQTPPRLESDIDCFFPSDCDRPDYMSKERCSFLQGYDSKSKCTDRRDNFQDVFCYFPDSTKCKGEILPSKGECRRARGFSTLEACEENVKEISKKSVDCFFTVKDCKDPIKKTTEQCKNDKGYLSQILCNEFKDPETKKVDCYFSNRTCLEPVYKSLAQCNKEGGYPSEKECKAAINLGKGNYCWQINRTTFSPINFDRNCVESGKPMQYNECNPPDYYNTRQECVQSLVEENFTASCWYVEKLATSINYNICLNITSSYLECYNQDGLLRSGRYKDEAACKNGILENPKNIQPGEYCTDYLNCPCIEGGKQKVIETGKVCSGWDYSVTKDTGAPKSECKQGVSGRFPSFESCNYHRSGVVAIKLCEYVGIGSKPCESGKTLEEAIDKETGLVCVSRRSQIGELWVNPSGIPEDKTPFWKQLHEIDNASDNYSFHPITDCEGSTVSFLEKDNKFVTNTYAAEENKSTSDIFYFPESGIYEVTTTDGGKATMLGGKDNRYLLYYDRNGEDGYQSPEDPKNPKENEDRIVPQSASIVNVSKVIDSQEMKVKEGINIVSFNFLPVVGEDKSMTMGDFLKLVNSKDNIISRISYFSAGSWVGGAVYDFSTKEVKGLADEVLTFGKGYILVATKTGSLDIPGKALNSSVPIAFSSGWNLVGVHGYSEAYTAKTFIESINTIEGLKANNVTWWPTSRGMYQGYQLQNGQEYGQDFPISPINGYFVRIAEFTPKEDTCKSLIWNPSGEMNGECGSNN